VPYEFLTCGLFGVSDKHRVQLNNAPLPTPSNYSIEFTGLSLTQTDKKIYWICLALMRDMPVTHGITTAVATEPATLTAYRGNLWYVIKLTELAKHYSGRDEPGGSDLRRITESLDCLQQAVIRVNRANKGPVQPLPRLIEYMHAPKSVTTARGLISGRGRILFRIPPEVAELFGAGCWTATYLARQLQLADMPLFLHDYFSAYRRGTWLDPVELHRLSRSSVKLSVFKTRLAGYLEALQDTELPGGAAIQKPMLLRNESTGTDEFWITPTELPKSRRGFKAPEIPTPKADAE
jgi:hypothetical protein